MPDTTPDPPPSAQASIAGRHIRALFLADNFTQVVRVAEAMLETVVSGAQVALWWTLRPGSPQASRLHCAPRGLRPWADPQQACAAMLAKTMLRGAPDDAGKAVWALPVQGHGGGQAVLQLQANVADFPRMENDATLVQSVELVARRVATLIEMRLLKRSVRRHERSERVQKALFHIADLSTKDHRTAHTHIEAVRRQHIIWLFDQHTHQAVIDTSIPPHSLDQGTSRANYDAFFRDDLDHLTRQPGF